MIILQILTILYYIVSVGWMLHYLISDSYESDELTVASLLGYILFVPLIGPFFFPIFAAEKLSEIKIRKKKDKTPYYLKSKKDLINEEA
jgi:cyanate permease